MKPFPKGWILGVLFILCCQIIPPLLGGNSRLFIARPSTVVLATLPVSFLVLWFLLRRGWKGKLIEGFVVSILAIFALSLVANVVILQTAR